MHHQAHDLHHNQHHQGKQHVKPEIGGNKEVPQKTSQPAQEPDYNGTSNKIQLLSLTVTKIIINYYSININKLITITIWLMAVQLKGFKLCLIFFLKQSLLIFINCF